MKLSLRTRAVVFAALGVFGVGRPALAQHAALVFDAPASTEAMAWGNAAYLFSNTPDLLFYSPALIGRTSGFSAGLQRYGSEGTLATLSAAGSVGLGDFAVGLQHFRYGADDFATAQDLQGAALTTGDFGVTELALSLGYAREIFGLDAGVVAKYFEQGFDQIEDASVAFDIGLATDVGPAMISLTARNLGPDLSLEHLSCADLACPPAMPPVDVEIPTGVALGISLEDFEVGELDVFVTSQFMRRRDGEIIPAGGVEVSYWPVQGYTFRLRAGLQRVVDDDRSPLTLGAAITGDALSLEYAFQSFDGEGNAHRFGLSWR